MSSLYVFVGPNGFTLREERRRWVSEFTERHGADTITMLDGAHLPMRDFLDDVGTMPFLAKKRLIIVQGIPRWEKEEIERLESSIHPDCIALFCDVAPDKRLGGLKALFKIATVKEFPILHGAALERWIVQEMKKAGGDIDAPGMAELLQTVGDDQDALFHEIQKLAAFCGPRTATADDVRMLAVPSREQEVWHITGLLARGDATGALRYARDLSSRGEDIHSLWNILLWSLRSLVAVRLAVREGKKDPAKITSATGVPFPTARTLVPLAERLNEATLRELLRWAVDADTALKTGGYKVTADAPQELHAIVDSLLLRMGTLTMSA